MTARSGGNPSGEDISAGIAPDCTPTIRQARAMAARKLSGRAFPVPAMSAAVPWSGEVRMIGRPRVTLTVWSKASVLAGISA